jgi:predicted acylesterase/phospholipase RssA
MNEPPLNDWDAEWDSWEMKEDDPHISPGLHDLKKATSLVLPSGGVKGVYILGALHYLYDECGGIKHITSFYGTSIGAIISGLLIIGYTPMEILIYICINKIVVYLLASFDITKIFTEKRFLDSTVFTRLLTEMIHSKAGCIPTLGDLFTKYGKKLCICTISRNDPMTPLYISSDSHPTIELVQALHMSASIPFVFGYAKYDEIDYFDGGVLDQFPVLYASQTGEHVFGIDIKRTFHKNESILNDLLDVISLPMNYISFLLKKNIPDNAIYIEIDTENEYTTKSNVELLKMFISGFQQCKCILILPKKAKIKQI